MLLYITMQSWMKACSVTSSKRSSWSPLSSPSYSMGRCGPCKKVSPDNTAKLFIITRRSVVFKVYIKTLLSNRKLKHMSSSGTVKLSSYTEKVAFYAQDLKIRLRGVVASFWMLQLHRGPSCSAVLKSEEDREDNMQQSFCLVRPTHLQKFPMGLK